MLTDITQGNTTLLVVSDNPQLIGNAFSTEIVNDEMNLPGVMSRKNRLFPFWKKHTGNRPIYQNTKAGPKTVRL